MKNDIVFAKCVDMSVDGHGIAKANDLVIFVKEMIVEEEGYVKIISEKKNYAFGIIDRLTKTSKYRKKSDCLISYKCGGCDYRYIDYDYQLELKRNVLINTFKEFKVNEIIKDDNPYYYRNKVQVPIRDNKIGFYRKYSNDIVEFDDCLIESKLANDIIAYLKIELINTKLTKYFRHILIKHAKYTDEVMIGFIVNNFDLDLTNLVNKLTNKFIQIKSIILNLNDKNTNVILGDLEKVLYGRDYIYDIYDGIKVKLSLKSFYQVNYDQMLKLYNKVLQLANINKNDELLDLYCGIGTISLYMARYCKHVTGVEIVDKAIENARENALINNINNIDFVLADASKAMDEYLVNKDIVIIDPPRKGTSKELINSIINANIKKVIYVSCNPATLYRDLQLFKEYYDISDINPIDLFGFTTHVECVVALNKK